MDEKDSAKKYAPGPPPKSDAYIPPTLAQTAIAGILKAMRPGSKRGK